MNSVIDTLKIICNDLFSEENKFDSRLDSEFAKKNDPYIFQKSSSGSMDVCPLRLVIRATPLWAKGWQIDLEMQRASSPFRTQPWRYVKNGRVRGFKTGLSKDDALDFIAKLKSDSGTYLNQTLKEVGLLGVLERDDIRSSHDGHGRYHSLQTHLRDMSCSLDLK